MSASQKTDYEKVKAILAGWKTHRPNKSFAGMTLEQFIARISPITTSRTKVAEQESLLKAAITERDDADKAALVEALLVVNAVKGDREEGEDGELYEAMGYVRKSERKTGLSRKTKAVAAKA